MDCKIISEYLIEMSKSGQDILDVKISIPFDTYDIPNEKIVTIYNKKNITLFFNNAFYDKLSESKSIQIKEWGDIKNEMVIYNIFVPSVDYYSNYVYYTDSKMFEYNIYASLYIKLDMLKSLCKTYFKNEWARVENTINTHFLDMIKSGKTVYEALVSCKNLAKDLLFSNNFWLSKML